MTLGKNVHHASEKSSDVWLTPPDLIKLLGPFDLDPCTPPVMPWSTAKKMVSLPTDGLTIPWRGLVFCNPPYSRVGPWVDRMVEHDNGIMLVSAKSPDSNWGNKLLREADLVLYLKKRIKFYYLDGTQSKGKILPNALAAFGRVAVERLKRLKNTSYHGVYMQQIGDDE